MRRLLLNLIILVILFGCSQKDIVEKNDWIYRKFDYHFDESSTQHKDEIVINRLKNLYRDDPFNPFVEMESIDHLNLTRNIDDYLELEFLNVYVDKDKKLSYYVFAIQRINDVLVIYVLNDQDIIVDHFLGSTWDE